MVGIRTSGCGCILLAGYPRAVAPKSSRLVVDSLREHQERLTAALSAAGAGTFRWDAASDSVDWDANLDTLLGLPPEARGGSLETFLSTVHPAYRKMVTDGYRGCANTGAGLELEFRVLWPDGSEHWIEAKGKRFAVANGSSPRPYVAGTCSELTSRRGAEAAQRDETRLLEVLNQTAHLLGSTLDLRTLVQRITDVTTQLSGARVGAFFYNATDQGDAYQLYALSGAPREAFDRLNQRRAALFGPLFRGELPVRCDDVITDPRFGTMPMEDGGSDGSLTMRSCLAVPVVSRSGAVHGALLLGHPDVGVFTEPSERLAVGIAAQAGTAIDNARIFESAQRTAEDRKALLESERAARNTAERTSDIKDEFLATLSHELRTPLNAILGWSKILRNNSKNAEDMTRGLEAIERNARAQTQLIDDLLDMSRITSGKLRLDLQPIRPADVITQAVDTVKTAADAKEIRLERVLDPSIEPMSGDPVRLQQVVWNLLSNAIKFTPQGGRVRVTLEPVDSHVEISVEDTGCGIRPEFLPHLFERFRQADSTTTRQHGGLGLGLSIVKTLVELHGGSVRARSEGVGQGTTITVQLPSGAQAGERAERRHTLSTQPLAASVTATELAGLTVLVVDDQADARELIKRVLEDCAAKVVTAANADEALRLVEGRRPHVLVSDIGMPDVDGFELLRRVRALGPDRGGRLPAVALTAFARTEDRTRVLRAGFLVHVAKPVDPSELVATVASVSGRASGYV
jgi:signal transduction histidine kinase/ActR/RegA family two-component response regulator